MPEAGKEEKENRMRELVLDKLVINIGTGSDENAQAHAKKLLEMITNRKPANAVSKKRNPAFKVVKGQNIGAFVTVRGKEIKPLASRLIGAVDDRLRETAVAENSVSFGIHEYIDISGVKYDPKIGMLGMNVNLTFKRRGARVALRKRMCARVPKSHRIVDRGLIKQYMQNEFKVEFI